METTKWALDPTHSEIQFKVKHLLISTVTGHFKQFNATVETDGEDLSTAKVHMTADLSSISTNNELPIIYSLAVRIVEWYPSTY